MTDTIDAARTTPDDVEAVVAEGWRRPGTIYDIARLAGVSAQSVSPL